MTEERVGYPRIELLIRFLIALTPLVIGVVGALYSSAIKDKEVRAQYVGLSLEILREEPDMTPRGLREWAVNVLSAYSEKKLSEEARGELLDKPLVASGSALIYVTPDIPGRFKSSGFLDGVIEISGLEESSVLGLKIRDGAGTLAMRPRLTIGETVPVARADHTLNVTLQFLEDGAGAFLVAPGS